MVTNNVTVYQFEVGLDEVSNSISNYIHHNSDKKANIQHIHFTNSQFSQRMKDTKNKQSLTTTTITQSTLTRNLTSSAKVGE